MKENPEESTEDEEVAEQNAFETETAGDYGCLLYTSTP